MAENQPTTWLIPTDLRSRGSSKGMCKALLPELGEIVGLPQPSADG